MVDPVLTEPGQAGVPGDDGAPFGFGGDAVEIVEAVGRAGVHDIDNALGTPLTVLHDDRTGDGPPFGVVGAQCLHDRRVCGDVPRQSHGIQDGLARAVATDGVHRMCRITKRVTRSCDQRGSGSRSQFGYS